MRKQSLCFKSSRYSRGSQGIPLVCFEAAGFTLLEIIITITLIGIMGVVTLGFLNQMIQANQDATGQNDVMDEVNLALEFMAQELRLVDDFTWPIHCGNPSSTCVPNTAYTRIEFSKDMEIPTDVTRRDTNYDDIVYNLNGTTLERTSNSITTTLATDVQNFSVTEIPNPGEPTMPTGIFQITLQINRPSPDPSIIYNFSGTTGVRIRNRMQLLNVAFVVDNSASLDAEREVDYNNHLQNTLGHTVSLFSDQDSSWAPANFNVVILSGDGNASDNWLANTAVPIMTLHSADYNEFDLGTGNDTDGGDPTATVQSTNHFITKIFSAGNRAFDSGVIVNTPDRGYITGYANDVTRLISYASSTQAKLLVVPRSGTLASGGGTAAARRAFLGMRNYRESGQELNRDGLKLFNRTLAWLAGN